MTEGLDLHLGVDKGAGFVGRALETALREAIRSGRLHAGARLPGSRSLAADLGISRGTVVQAYAQLIAEGWLTGTTGSGFLTVFPCGTRPDASSLNYVGGQSVPDAVIAPPGLGTAALEAPSAADPARAHGESLWIAIALGGVSLLFVRAALLGTFRSLVDSFVLYFFFALGALFLLSAELSRFGGELASFGAARPALGA